MLGTATAGAMEISAKVAKSLEEIVGKARQVDELAGEVAAASREQSQGITQVNTAVSQMDKVTQSNAANAEESAAAAEELNAQAEAMKDVVKELLQLVGGASASRSSGAILSTESKSAHLRSVKPPRAPAGANGRNSGNSHPAPARQAAASAIPMDSDFKEF